MNRETDNSGSFKNIRTFVKRLFREKPLGAFGFVMIILFVFIAIAADQIAPDGINETDPYNRLKGPSAEHILGTDNTGRDMFSRVIYGARTSVIIGFLSAAVAVSLGVVIGVLSGYFGGLLDLLVQRFIDTMVCLPMIILLMFIMSMLEGNTMTVAAVLGIHSGLTVSRIIRGAAIGVKENVFVKAAIATGCVNSRIIFRHIIPNIMPDILIVFATRIPNMILTEASLSYLGFGVQPPTPSWGGMLSSSAITYMYSAPWMVIWPGLFLTLLIFSVNMFADALRDLVDPKLRGNAGASDFRLPGKKLIRRITKGYNIQIRIGKERNNG
jgi:peptide/nickel transport system permease protein